MFSITTFRKSLLGSLPLCKPLPASLAYISSQAELSIIETSNNLQPPALARFTNVVADHALGTLFELNHPKCSSFFITILGCSIFDKSGKEYLDFASGIGAASTGHCHPRYLRNHVPSKDNILLPLGWLKQQRHRWTEVFTFNKIVFTMMLLLMCWRGMSL